jgi:ArsR family transcriptional regulator, arsenate/arsenite/antimonite-responsive transcriptional repressor / arsenate reductase (thioredoxin)
MNETDNLLATTGEISRETSAPKPEFQFAGPPVRILFLCTNNSARSQMAEALTRHLTRGQVEVFSAGSRPAAQVHPEAVSALARVGANMSQHVPKHLDQFHGQSFDRVVILRAREGEEGPSFLSPSKVVYWDFADPIEQSGTPEERARRFQALATELMFRIRLVLNLIARERRERYAS